MNLYPLLKPLLFSQDPETAHRLAFAAMGWASGALLAPVAVDKRIAESNPVTVAGLAFRNRLGLAAGFDKNALRLDAWARLGFGHAEIGTVTPRPQDGNAKPRLFRLVRDEALINRMGFNNDGAAAIRARLDQRPPPSQLIVGGNIGKNKETAEENAYRDYVACLVILHDAVDYITINVSSPNTPGLRDLQAREPLLRLLSEVQAYNQGLPVPRPIFLKISPDLTDLQLDDILAVAHQTQLAGIVATNTTLSRHHLGTPVNAIKAIGAGGLSGRPLRAQAQGLCKRIARRLQGSALIASGGVMTATDVSQRLADGASLVQIYTGFVYVGPELLRKSLKVTAL